MRHSLVQPLRAMTQFTIRPYGDESAVAMGSCAAARNGQLPSGDIDRHPLYRAVYFSTTQLCKVSRCGETDRVFERQYA